MANMKLLDGKLAEELIYVCSSEGLLESCAELLRVVPNPRLHPIIDILKVLPFSTRIILLYSELYILCVRMWYMYIPIYRLCIYTLQLW